MEHSTAILEDASNAIEGAAKSPPVPSTAESSKSRDRTDDGEGDRSNDHERRGKRKGNFNNDRCKGHGSRGGRGNNKRHKKGDLGRAEYLYVEILK